MNLTQSQPAMTTNAALLPPTEVTVYSHSRLFYWWPVWAMGYLLALVTYFQGESVPFAEAEVIIHPSKSLGVIFTVVVALVIIMTHAKVRGVASLAVIAAGLALTFLFAFMGWWDDIFRAVSSLAMYMNLGFYVFFSTALFLVWAMAFFVFDRFTYWTFRPGQVVLHQVFGGGEQTFDTHGMSVYKLRDDLFRHWILGFGSGDMHISTTGAVKQEFIAANVLFIGGKLDRIQRLVAMKPDESAPVVTAGQPD